MHSSRLLRYWLVVASILVFPPTSCPDISRGALVEAFLNYIETEYYEWLRDNFRSFFNDGEPDWDWIREQIGADEE